MVMAVLDKSLDVFVMRSGVTKRVYLEKCGLVSWNMRKPRDRPPYLQLEWPESPGKADEEEVDDEKGHNAGAGGKESKETDKTKTDEKKNEKTISQDVHIFSLVRVRLEADQDPLKYNAILLHPRYSAEITDNDDDTAAS